MVKAFVANDVVNLESIVEITEGLKDKIKANPKVVQSYAKDMGINHTIATTEDGIITSKIGKVITDSFLPQSECKSLEELHHSFLSWVETLPETQDEERRNVNDSEDEDCMFFAVVPIIMVKA